MSARLLVVDDERLIRSSLKRAFEGAGYRVEAAGSLTEGLAACDAARFDLAIVDLKLSDGDGIDLVRLLRADSPETKVVVITAHGSVETAVAAMKLGAFDFVKKPFELDELITTVGNAHRATTLERRVAYHEGRERGKLDEESVRGRSPTMLELEREIAAVTRQPVPVVLVVGETGSGKALVARRLHFETARAAGPFVELNAATIPETLVESELFGHERGAFSDARQRKLGLVEVADGGTLFLDEVGDLAAAPQAKLLTFVESLTFRRVGGTATQTVDVRLVAATNRDLGALVKEGRFRADLFYRLSALTLSVPPLRARSDDILPLAERFLAGYSQQYQKHFRAITDEASSALRAWRWPGNVRELKAVIQRVVLMHDGEVVTIEQLPSDLVAAAVDPMPAALAGPATSLPTLDEMERRYMRAVLAVHGGNKVRAAERLGITRQTLAKRLGESE